LVDLRCSFFVHSLVHSILVGKKEGPGDTPLQRTTFMKSARYRIGTQVFSLLDVSYFVVPFRFIMFVVAVLD
jgi:hypothetical protein